MNAIKNQTGQQATSPLGAALEYAGFGWPVFPLRPRDKRPLTRNGFKAGTTDLAKIKRWWKEHPNANIGIVTGKPSGIVVLDIDPRNGGDRSIKELTDRLGKLPPGPVAKTSGRGRHVLLRHPGRPVKKPSGDAPGIDIKADGGYVVGVGSIHKSGTPYLWDVPPNGSPLPELPETWLKWLDARNATERTERTETTERTEDYRENGGNSVSVVCFAKRLSNESETERAVTESLPVAVGRRNRQVFELARALKAVPALADASPDQLQNHVRRWHGMGVAKEVIRTEPFEETWIDFLKCWPKVKFPKGSEPMAEIVEKARRLPPPSAATKYESPRLQLLVAICRELQQSAGGEPFYLACRTAGRLAGVDHSTAARWLWLLVHDGILAEAEKGDRTRRRATRYRYLGD